MQFSRFNNFKRIFWAIGGTSGVAASNFILPLLLLTAVAPAQFGLFGFMRVVVGLGYGVSNALFGSPLMVVLNRTDAQPKGVGESFFKASFFFSLAAAFLLAGLVLVFGEAISTAVIFACSAALMWTRWFGRSYANAIHEPNRVAVSDAVYTIVTLVGAAILFWAGVVTIREFAGLQGLGAGIGILALGLRSLKIQLRGIVSGSFLQFLCGFRDQGRHALVGVLSTEATSNAHAYIVTFFFGPAAFAPLSAAALLFRPVPIIILSLTQLERPRLARLLHDGASVAAWRVIRTFRGAVLGLWAVNILLAHVVVTYFLEAVVRGDHNPQIIAQATIFWGLIMGLRCLRGPESALVQANGDFRPLSRVTIISSIVSLPLVFLLVLFSGALWSLGGVLAGEVAATLLTMRLATKLFLSKGPVELAVKNG